jgi:hypothetical protein
MEHFEGYIWHKTNGHFFSIGTLLIHQGLVCCSGHRDGWENFVSNVFEAHAALVIASYGRSSAAMPSRPHFVVRRVASPRTLSQSVVLEGTSNTLALKWIMGINKRTAIVVNRS